MEWTVEMGSRTADALRARGGNLYVWRDSATMLHARTQQPAEPLLYDTFDGEGWRVHVAREIPPPPRWVVHYKRLPWPHFDALYDPPETRDLLGTIIEGSWPLG